MVWGVFARILKNKKKTTRQKIVKLAQTLLAVVGDDSLPNPEACYDITTGKFHCPICTRGYGRRDTMIGHYRHECQKPPRFRCPYCTLVSKKTSNVYQHIRNVHPSKKVSVVKLYWLVFYIIIFFQITKTIILDFLLHKTHKELMYRE